MKNQKIKKAILFATILLAIVVIAGCPKLDHGGKLDQNHAPAIFWADVPIVHQYTRNPQLRYYSTDVDGLVLDYQYCVLMGYAVDSVYGGPAEVAQAFPDTAHWTIVHEDSTTVPLYSSSDTGSYVDQYVFLRAMDDDSTFSTIIYTNLARKNHAPTCFLVLPEGAQWCLPETTSTWKGIKVSWVGKDSIDIPGIQPDFDWRIWVYGPFPDSASADTLPDHWYMNMISISPAGDTSDWVRAKNDVFTDFVTGWYIVYAQNRDDAFVSSIPALGYLNVFEPTWIRHPEQTKPILLAKHNRYRYVNRNLGTSGELIRSYRDSVDQFYMTLLEDAGYSSADIDTFSATDPGNIGGETSVPMSLLYNHQLVIAVDIDMGFELTVNQELAYMDYLDVGGNLWVNGRRSFENGSADGRIEFGSDIAAGHPMPSTHFDLSGAFCDRIGNFHSAEFIGATPYNPDFPALTIDTMRVHQTSGDSTTQFWHALKGVDFLIRLDNAEPLYKFEAIYPDTSRFQNLPTAVRYDAGTYKTSYFSFPLYFIQTDQAVAVTQQMLTWFLSGQRLAVHHNNNDVGHQWRVQN